MNGISRDNLIVKPIVNYSYELNKVSGSSSIQCPVLRLFFPYFELFIYPPLGPVDMIVICHSWPGPTRWRQMPTPMFLVLISSELALTI
jgi:hypothetical protein